MAIIIFMKIISVIIDDLKLIREIEKKLEQEHIASMKKANEEIQKMLAIQSIKKKR